MHNDQLPSGFAKVLFVFFLVIVVLALALWWGVGHVAAPAKPMFATSTVQQTTPTVSITTLRVATTSASASTVEHLPTKDISIAGNTVRVEIANTEASREQGLSGRTGLAPNTGMLFVFPYASIWGMWMKDMQFSLDMLWVGPDGTIVELKKDLAPDTYPESFASTEPALYVIELPAGYISAHNLMKGETVQF